MVATILRFAATVAVIPLCATYLPGVHMQNVQGAALIGAILGGLYIVIRPLARLLLKVINWLTLGLLYVVLDAWLVWTAVGMMDGAVTLDHIGWAAAVALAVNVARTLIGLMTGSLKK